MYIYKYMFINILALTIAREGGVEENIKQVKDTESLTLASISNHLDENTYG